jgi:hypothetical protein
MRISEISNSDPEGNKDRLLHSQPQWPRLISGR